jgi:Uma2 family endonuclease
MLADERRIIGRAGADPGLTRGRSSAGGSGSSVDERGLRVWVPATNETRDGGPGTRYLAVMETLLISTARSRRPAGRATLEEWLAIPEEQRAELIDGHIVYQGMPGPLHGRAQGKTFALVDGPFGRRLGGGGRPGGWWISQEVDIQIGVVGCRPDIVGWRRDRHPILPEPDARGLVTVAPDWVCEVLSPRTAAVDQGQKRRAYHTAGVLHYWLVDPTNGTLTVLERAERDYLILLVAGRIEIVRAPPFDAVEIPVGEIFGADDSEEETEPG